MDKDRLNEIIREMSNQIDMLAAPHTSPSNLSGFDTEELVRLVEQAMTIDSETERVAIPESEFKVGLIVFGANRTMPPKSFKFQNITREVSRTVYVTALIGGASFVGTLATAASIAYALYTATSTNIGFSDACVLHKAWKLAKENNEAFVSRERLISARNEISQEYQAPKLRSETEIVDAILNLKGLKAMEERDGILHLKERIICFADGTIRN
jgi:hypothetical protein